MKTYTIDEAVVDWTRIGVGFNISPTTMPVDTELLLLQTARVCPGMSRLFIMAATWLRRYGDLIGRHRLARLIHDELEPKHQPVLGLLLDIAQQGTHPLRFKSITDALPKAEKPYPVFEVEQISPFFIDRARGRASELALKWNLWVEPIELKFNALRPPSWVMAQHANLRTQADFRGDLRASILASLQFDDGAGQSELALARACGGSRSQVRNALTNLTLTGRVTRHKHHTHTVIQPAPQRRES